MIYQCDSSSLLAHSVAATSFDCTFTWLLSCVSAASFANTLYYTWLPHYVKVNASITCTKFSWKDIVPPGNPIRQLRLYWTLKRLWSPIRSRRIHCCIERPFITQCVCVLPSENALGFLCVKRRAYQSRSDRSRQWTRVVAE